MSVIEAITFDKGINNATNPLLLEEGELVACEGVSFDNVGKVQARASKQKVNSTAVGSIHTLHRYNNRLYCGDGSTARYKWDLNGYCDQYIPANGNFTSLGSMGSSKRWSWADTEDFCFVVNGYESKAFASGYAYDWSIPNPQTAPSGVLGASGDPSGTYSLYYTFQLTFPNGRIVETGPSPAGSVVVSSQKIEWSGIGTCSYAGTGVTIKRKLYRTSSALVDIYYVTTIGDNTTTTYSDNYSDSLLETTGTIMSVDSYAPAPDKMTDICEYLSRLFGIKDNYLYMSEPYLPFSFDLGNSIQVTPSGYNLISLRKWGDQIYLATKDSWYRLQGSTTSTWAIKNTWAEQGAINPYATQVTPHGIVHQWYDGLYLFDGQASKKITEGRILDSVFTGMTSPTSAFSEWDGTRYWFAYPSTGTTIDKVLVLDFSEYPKVRIYNDNFLITAFEHNFLTGIKYYGKADGYQYRDYTGETYAFSLQTRDMAAKDIFRLKEAEYLLYDIDTGGVDVVVTVYVDGTAQTPVFKLNKSTRTRDRLSLAGFTGYRFSLKIDCANAENVIFYAPWAITFNPKGV